MDINLDIVRCVYLCVCFYKNVTNILADMLPE